MISLPFISCRQSIRGMLEPGVSKSLAQYRKKHISQVAYELFFSIPEQKDVPVEGQVTITFEHNRAQHGVILDFRGGAQNIHEVMVEGNPVDYQYLNEHIVISSQHIKPGENQVHIRFTATDQALNRSEEFMYTLFVPDRAATAFPCFDQPDLKATFALSLEVPESWSALSNGPQLSTTMNDQQRKVVAFAADKPISTYLFAFTAGQYQTLTQTHQGRSITLLHRETDLSKIEHNVPGIFRQHFQALEWLEEYTGISYPFSKFDLAIIPGFQYSGMEHPGAVWYRDSRLLLDEKASMSQQLQKASLIAHETAHMWFGDLVTMQWFDDVWLKEVFAGFMADKMVQPLFPGQNHALQFLLTHYPRAYEVDRSAGTHPVRQSLQNLNQAGNLYGSIIYNKAPIVFQQLERIMGEASFRLAVKEYLDTYAFDNADWDQLVYFFDKHSAENISQWSQAWVYEKGMPRIDYQAHPGEDGLMTVELHSNNLPDDAPYPSQWIEMAILTSEKHQQQEWYLSGNQVDMTFLVDDEKPVLIPNGFGWGYGYFALREEDRTYLLKNIQAIGHDNVRAASHIMLYEDFLNGNINPLSYSATLIHNLKTEEHPLLVSYLLDITRTVFWSFLDHAQQQEVAEELATVLWKQMLAARPEMKSSYFQSYASVVLHPEHYSNLISLFREEMVVRDYELSEDDRFTIVKALCLRGHEQGMTLLEQLKKETTQSDRIRRLEYLQPALSPDPVHREAFFGKLQEPAHRRPEPWALEGLELLHHPLRADHGIGFLPKTLEMTREIQQTGDIFFPLRWLNTALQGYNDPRALKIVEDYLETNDTLGESLRLKVLQASDKLERSVMIRNRY
ncbi:MAG: M1 family aminopeptidase [Bacteroidales bacterium]